MLNKVSVLKYKKTLFLIKVSIQNDKMQDFERLFTKLWLRKQRSSQFLIKNNKHYFF